MMHIKSIHILILGMMFLISCNSKPPSPKLVGKFHIDSDLFIAHFDCKTDVDDLYSVAGVATILADSRLSNVQYHVVAGAYGIQEGLYVPANELFEIAFPGNWSDAHANFDQALREETTVAVTTLKNGGNIWIAEGGQSDFSAALIRNIKTLLSDVNTESRINIVQHSDWNENNTAHDNLTYVKDNVSYHKMPDGNVTGNGSPGLKTDSIFNWRDYIPNKKLAHIWKKAIEIANNYNGKDNRYNNPAIANGGMDFSDVSETCWIFGFDKLENVKQFFKEFSTSSNL